MTNESDLLRGNTPTMILAVLLEGPQHGYAIAQEINRQTGDTLKFKQGTVYPVLHTLERDGLVRSEWQHPAGGRPRLVYEVTESGRAALAERVEVWNRFSEAMNRLISSTGSGEANEQPA